MHEPTSLSNNILFLAGQVAKLVNDAVTASFREAGQDLTAEQFSVLVVLWYKEGVNQQILAEELHRDKTTVARVVRNMEKKSLLVRVPDKTDLRNKLIYLTEKGKRLQEDLVNLTGKVYVAAIGDLRENDLSEGIRVLQQIHKNLS